MRKMIRIPRKILMPSLIRNQDKRNRRFRRRINLRQVMFKIKKNPKKNKANNRWSTSQRSRLMMVLNKLKTKVKKKSLLE